MELIRARETDDIVEAIMSWDDLTDRSDFDEKDFYELLDFIVVNTYSPTEYVMSKYGYELQLLSFSKFD